MLSGALCLGIIPTLAPYILPRLLPRLQAAYPKLRLEVRETQTKLLLDELAGGALDCVMLALPVEGADPGDVAAVYESIPGWRRQPQTSCMAASALRISTSAG